MNEEVVQRFLQFADDYESGYLYDPDGTQLSSDMAMPTKDLLNEFHKTADKSDYMSKDEFLKFQSRIYQYMNRLIIELNSIQTKMGKASKRVTEEIAEDIIRGDFGEV